MVPDLPADDLPFLLFFTVMRSDGNMRLILNLPLFDGMVAELASDKSVRFIGVDPEHHKSQTYLLRVSFFSSSPLMRVCHL